MYYLLIKYFIKNQNYILIFNIVTYIKKFNTYINKLFNL